MFKPNLYKSISLFFIVIAAQILLSMIEGKIEERSNNREHARGLIKKSWTGDQTLLGAVLTVPFQKAEKQRVFDQELNHYVVKLNWVDDELFILPKRMSIDSKLQHQILSKGIYDVPVYTSIQSFTGHFDLSKLRIMSTDPHIKLSKDTSLSFGVSDTRGLSSPAIQVLQQQLDVKPGSKLTFFKSGFHSKVRLEELTDFEFDMQMQLKGMGRIAFIATARENEAKMISDWPHPSFEGAFLPIERKISTEGYTARWKTGIFSTDIENIIGRCFEQECGNIYDSAFGVNHIQSVDIYLKSLRSVKYGLLVVIITFTIFILYEVLNKGIRIHPVSYFLTGMALSIFFLLLIALSEHLTFELSYWISSFACSGLIGYYISFVAKSKRHGRLVFALLNSFYLILFFIILSEDHALLSGSILMFGLLTVVIVLTRKVDWYSLSSTEKIPSDI
jgi:inner membrane protein